MGKLALAADLVTATLQWLLPALAALHALLIAAYAALARDGRAVLALLPRNGLLIALVLGLGLAMGPLHRRAERWHHADAYGGAAAVEQAIATGRYRDAFALGAAVMPDTPPRRTIDAELEALQPRLLTRAIALANDGHFVAAIALAEALPPEGPLGHKRRRVLALWEAGAARERAHERRRQAAWLAPRIAGLQEPLTRYDALAAEIVPRALELDPAALARIGGASVHPLAPALLDATVRGKRLQHALADMPAKDAVARVRDELATAAGQLVRGCEESLVYANTADPHHADDAKQAFERARAARARAADVVAGDLPATLAAPPATPAAPATVGAQALATGRS